MLKNSWNLSVKVIDFVLFNPILVEVKTIILYLVFQFAFQVFIVGFFVVAFVMMMASGKNTLLTTTSIDKFETSFAKKSRWFPKFHLFCNQTSIIYEYCSYILSFDASLESRKHTHFWKNGYFCCCLNLVFLQRKEYLGRIEKFWNQILTSIFISCQFLEDSSIQRDSILELLLMGQFVVL